MIRFKRMNYTIMMIRLKKIIRFQRMILFEDDDLDYYNMVKDDDLV